MKYSANPTVSNLNGFIVLAGLAGGMAEVVWIGFYSALSSVSGSEVAAQVTLTLFPAAAGWAGAPLSGIGIHLLLSVILGILFAVTVWIPYALHRGFMSTLLCAIGLVVVVWSVNFLLVLPRLNPDFVHLMPSIVTFISKMLFGITMALVLSGLQKRTTVGIASE